MIKIVELTKENEESKYYTANTDNAIELDTYITAPESTKSGIARIIVYEGIKKIWKDILKIRKVMRNFYVQHNIEIICHQNMYQNFSD